MNATITFSEFHVTYKLPEGPFTQKEVSNIRFAKNGKAVSGFVQTMYHMAKGLSRVPVGTKVVATVEGEKNVSLVYLGHTVNYCHFVRTRSGSTRAWRSERMGVEFRFQTMNGETFTCMTYTGCYKTHNILSQNSLNKHENILTHEQVQQRGGLTVTWS